MRQIEFRGKRIDNGKWVYGSLYGTQIIIENIIEYGDSDYFGVNVRNFHKVNPSIIGQFTGLVDKNGKRIYEGDLVNVILSNIIGECCHTDKITVTDITDYSLIAMLDNANELEVIGNIHTKENK